VRLTTDEGLRAVTDAVVREVWDRGAMRPEPTHVLDHVGLGVRDVEASRRFFEAALAPLGFAL
jgi:hypothetical protein